METWGSGYSRIRRSFAQGSIYDIVWARDPETGKEVKYGDVRLADEQQFSVYNFEAADVQSTWKHFELCEEECKKLIERYSALTKD